MKVYFQSIVWGFDFDSIALVTNVRKGHLKTTPWVHYKKPDDGFPTVARP